MNFHNYVVLSVGMATVALGVVEIVGGTNAGKVTLTDSTGLYRLDDLRTSQGFQIEVSATGYQTSRPYVGDLKSNARFDRTLSK